MPLATLVLPGNRDDDGLYVPAITRARRVVGQGGDCTIENGLEIGKNPGPSPYRASLALNIIRASQG